MSFFSRDNLVYSDATLGTVSSWDSLHDLFSQYMPAWGEGVSYATAVLGNEHSAVVVLRDSPELFGAEILALAAVGSACVFFFFQAIVMVIFMVILRSAPDPAYFPLLILALIAGVILASGLAILLSSVNVYLRDTQHLIEVVLTGWFWACPIVYSYQTVEAKLGPRGLTWIYLINPMTPLVLAFQRCLYNKPIVTISGKATAVLPQHGYLWYFLLVLAVLVLGLVLFLVALATFGRLEGNFAEEL